MGMTGFRIRFVVLRGLDEVLVAGRSNVTHQAGAGGDGHVGVGLVTPDLALEVTVQVAGRQGRPGSEFPTMTLHHEMRCQEVAVWAARRSKI